MIIHASTKMDISNYINWLDARLREGFFDKEYNNKIINRILLKDIEEIILYTRTPSKIYRNSDILNGYKTKLITFISHYDSLFEPKIKEKEKILRCILRCRKKFEQNYFGYGPVFFTEVHNREWHLAQFDYLCQVLAPYVDGAYISFRINETCQKTKNTTCRPLDKMEQTMIMSDFKTIAEKYKLNVFQMVYEEDFKDNEIDIGEANCCPYACIYCPYISNRHSAIDKYKVFNPSSSILYGMIANTQKIIEIDMEEEAKAKALKQNKKQYEQTSLFEML